MTLKNKIPPVLLLLLVSINCSNKVSSGLNTTNESANNKFKELVMRGNKEFNKMHWIGWTNSIRIFSDALKIKNSNAIKEKLYFSFLLRALRANFFSVNNEFDLKKAGELSIDLNRKFSNVDIYFKIAEKYLLPDISTEYTAEDITKLKKNRTDKDYLYFFYSLYNNKSLDIKSYRREAAKFIELFPNSNFKYFFRDIFIDIEKGIRENHDFIELILTRADRFYNIGNYKKAEEYYLKVLEYDEKIPLALTGLGNIYTHFELYSKALKYYNKSVAYCPLYYKTLFGQAVCLSQMGEYNNSIKVLDLMLKKDLWYKGEIFYYRAFNNFLLGEYHKVEEDLKSSEIYIPESVELNTLFGMYYYETKIFDKARKYFNKAIAGNNKYPRPYYFLGYIDLKNSDIKNALKNFLQAAQLYLEMIDRNIDKLNNLDNEKFANEMISEIRLIRRKRIKAKTTEIILKLNNIIKIFGQLENRKLDDIIKVIKKLKSKLN